MTRGPSADYPSYWWDMIVPDTIIFAFCLLVLVPAVLALSFECMGLGFLWDFCFRSGNPK